MQIQRDSNYAASTLLFPPRVELSNHTSFELHTEWQVPGRLFGEAEYLPQAIDDQEDLGRGVRWALAIEVSAALCICGIWSFCRLLF
jgi:hypothetical protein